MSNVDDKDIQFQASGEESLSSYRSLNRAAVLALILGISSVLSLIHWLLLIIAVAAILVAVIALRQIAARPDELLGRKLAIAAITLAVFFLSYGLTREFSRRNVMKQQAREHAEQWFQMLQKGDLPNLYKAFELEKPYPERQPEGTDLAERFGDPNQFEPVEGMSTDTEMMDAYVPRRNFHSFVHRELIQLIVGLGTQSEFNFVRIVGFVQGASQDVVILEYELNYDKGGEATSTPLFVKMGRNFYRDIEEGHWNVISVAKSVESL